MPFLYNLNKRMISVGVYRGDVSKAYLYKCKSTCYLRTEFMLACASNSHMLWASCTSGAQSNADTGTVFVLCQAECCFSVSPCYTVPPSSLYKKGVNPVGGNTVLLQVWLQIQPKGAQFIQLLLPRHGGGLIDSSENEVKRSHLL